MDPLDLLTPELRAKVESGEYVIAAKETWYSEDKPVLRDTHARLVKGSGKLKKDQRPARHGAGLAWQGCKCTECRAHLSRLGKIQNQKRIESFKANGLPPGQEHGLRKTYLLGCRCEPCCTFNAQYSRARAVKRRSLTDKVKSVPCADCGIQYPPYIMDFDHRPDETKLFDISKGISASVERLEVEIAKCDVVCSNCHRARTYERGNSYGRLYA